MNNQTKALIQLKEIGFPLVNIRKSLPKLIGTSQPEMARRRNLSRANVTAYINGRGKNPAVKEAIAAELDVPVDDLFSE